MKRLYLDVCTYCRPFDDQNFLRIRLETDAFYLIMQYLKQEKYQAVVSPVHFKEINAIPEFKKRIKIQALLRKIDTKILYDADKARQRAEELYNFKFGILEATRFLALKSESKLDSIKWHQKWQAQLNKNDFFDSVF